MSVLQINRRRRKRPSKRSGVAAIEFAMVLPVLLILTIGTMDLCSLMFLKESVVLAAYEGARQGVGRGRTNADATARITEFLDERNITHNGAGSVVISGGGFEGAETLEAVTVTVTVPTDGNLLIPSDLFGGMTVSADVTMVKEYENLDNN
jgi:Flp pilus assembly protein TadG